MGVGQGRPFPHSQPSPCTWSCFLFFHQCQVDSCTGSAYGCRDHQHREPGGAEGSVPKQLAFSGPFPALIPAPNPNPGPPCFQPNGHTRKATSQSPAQAPCPSAQTHRGGSAVPPSAAVFPASQVSPSVPPQSYLARGPAWDSPPAARRPPCHTWSAARAGSRRGPDREPVSSPCGSQRAPARAAAVPSSAPGACISAGWAGYAGA